MLAYTNWKTDLILLNFNDDLSKEALSKLDAKFISDRESFPALSIVTSTGEPDKHVVWTRKTPSVEVLARITLLARRAIDLIQTTLFEDFHAETLFEASLQGYDLVIALDGHQVRNSLLTDLNTKSKAGYGPVTVAEYNPVASFLAELRVRRLNLSPFYRI